MFLVEGMSKSGAGRPTLASAMMSVIPPVDFEKGLGRRARLTSSKRARVKKNLRATRSTLALTVGAHAHERQVDGLGLEARAARGGADELGRLGEVEVHELAAARADGVVVARGLGRRG